MSQHSTGRLREAEAGSRPHPRHRRSVAIERRHVESHNRTGGVRFKTNAGRSWKVSISCSLNECPNTARAVW